MIYFKLLRSRLLVVVTIEITTMFTITLTKSTLSTQKPQPVCNMINTGNVTRRDVVLSYALQACYLKTISLVSLSYDSLVNGILLKWALFEEGKVDVFIFR